MSHKISKKIALIGVGNMGSSILSGVLRLGFVQPDQTWVYDKFEEKVRDFTKQWKSNLSSSAQDAVASADIVLVRLILISGWFSVLILISLHP